MSVTTTPARETRRRGSRAAPNSPSVFQLTVALTLPALLVTEAASDWAAAAGTELSSTPAVSNVIR